MHKIFIFISVSLFCIHSLFPEENFSNESGFMNQESSFSSLDSSSSLKAVRAEFGANFGNYIGIREGYSELGLLGIVETPSNLYILMEGRGFFLSHHDKVASMGLGFRKPLCDPSLILGGNIYYDYRTAHLSKEDNCECCTLNSSKKSFQSLGIGLELLSDCIDFRSNFYIPIKERQSRTSQFTYPDGYLGSITTTRYIPYGLDAEIGKRLNFFSGFYTSGAIGGYAYFYQHTKNIYGTFARLELDWGDYISLQARYSYDQHYHSGFQGRVLFSLPFEQLANCFNSCSAICFDPIVQPIRRNYIPFTQKKCCWKWNW